MNFINHLVFLGRIIMRFKRIIILVLDGCGCGVQPDFRNYHKRKTNTLGNLYKTPHSSFRLPFLESLGLSQILSLDRDNPHASYGILQEKSLGNDTFAGVWEMIGVPFDRRFRSGKRGLGRKTLGEISKSLKTSTLCNRYMSGYKVLDQYYEQHSKTSYPILYLADDGVVLFAAHENVMAPQRLNELAEQLSLALQSQSNEFARVITRPFSGNKGKIIRLEKYRRDFMATPAIGTSLLVQLAEKNIGIRLTEHLFRLFGSPQDVDVLHGSYNNEELMPLIAKDVRERPNGLFMYVLQDTDNFGHKKDTSSFRKSLLAVDNWLKSFVNKLGTNDLLLITADHGCDSTVLMRGHNREYVPILLYSPQGLEDGFLGRRKTFADIGQTICYNFDLPHLKIGSPLITL